MTDQPDSRTEINPEIIAMLDGYSERSYEERDAMRAAVRARGADAVPTLIAIVDGAVAPAMMPADQADQLLDPVAVLLGEIGHPDAIEPLIKALARVARIDSNNLALSSISDALAEMGAPALEPLLAAFGDAQERDHRAAVANALSQLGVKDERVYQCLLDTLKTDVFWGCHALEAYGDSRAVPHIRRAFDDYDAAALYPGLSAREYDADVEADMETLQSALQSFGIDISDEIEARFDPPGENEDDEDDEDDEDFHDLDT